MNERLVELIDRRNPDECWPWKGTLDKDKYGVTTIPGSRQIRVHRAAYEMYRGPIPKDAIVCHSCDNPPCCNPDHLFIGTRADNNRDMMSKWRHTHGSTHHKSKMTEADVRRLRDMHEKHPCMSQWSLAEQFGINQTVVGDILARRTWKHVP